MYYLISLLHIYINKLFRILEFKKDFKKTQKYKITKV